MIYIISGVVALIISLLVAIKIEHYAHAATKVRLKSMTETALSAQVAITQNTKTNGAVVVVKEKLIVAQQAAQVKIDAGERNYFDTDNFGDGC